MSHTPKPRHEWDEDELADGRAMMPEIEVLVVIPGQAPELRQIPNTLAGLQAVVGGTICTFSTGVRGTIGFCHDEGINLNFPPCRYLPHTRQLIFGTIFFAGNGINTHGLCASEIAELMEIYEPWLKRWQIFDAIKAQDEMTAEIEAHNARVYAA